MKHRILSIAAIFAVFATLMSCQEKTPEVVYSEVPFETISITAGDETVDGVISGTNVTFSFAAVEDFTACSINFEVNEGWVCTWPTDPANVDLTVDENLVLQFTSPKNAIVKYYISFTSNSLPIADPSKIKVKGDDAAVVEVNNAKKTLKIYYNQETMNEAAIELVFEEGALIPGATYEGSAFDFTETLSNPFVIKTSTGDVTYTLKLDKSSLMPNPATLGFSDITADYTDAEGVTIFKATAINGVPERQRFYGGSQFVQETPYGPYDGWIYMNNDPDKTVWVALGDWTEDRTTVNIDPCEVVVVLLDQTEVAGKMFCADGGVTAGTVSSLVTVTGHSLAQGDAGLYADGKFYDDYASATYVNYQNDLFPRTAIAFDAEGNFTTATIAYAWGDFYKWDKIYTDSSLPIATDQFSSTVNVTSVAWTCPAPVRGSHALTKDELQYSDCGWEPSFGDAWNGNRARMFAGVTEDGRIGFAAFQGSFGYIEELGWEDFNGVGTFQGAWLLQKFGFKDVIQIGTAMYGEDNFRPTIIVDGQTVIGDPAQNAAYCIGYDVR
ncbi:MAG: hypothetical protein IJB05_05345 [Bacteroidales bacterium]|nr:hypothetical protein [Bacteroidales bacterium]